MPFLESPRFPENLDKGSSYGSTWKTDITVLFSGHENTDQNWDQMRHRGSLGYDLLIAEAEEMKDYHTAVNGRTTGFRFKDKLDFKSTKVANSIAFDDQIIGQGDGTTLIFQIIKAYTKGANTHKRNIRKTVAGTELVGIGGVVQTTRFTVDSTTGKVTFSTNLTGTITAATEAANAALTVAGHGLAVGDTIVLDAMTGGTWSTQDGKRYTVQTVGGPNDFTIDLDSSSLGTYISGGDMNTAPMGTPVKSFTEDVTSGFEFDNAVRFGSDDLIATWDTIVSLTYAIPIMEIRT